MEIDAKGASGPIFSSIAILKNMFRNKKSRLFFNHFNVLQKARMRCNINVLDILKIRLNTFFISEHIFENRYNTNLIPKH